MGCELSVKGVYPMEGRKISFVVLAMAGLLTACGSRVWGDDSEISTALAFGEAEECTQNAKTREDTIVKISDCLSEQMPEIDDWAAYVDLKSDGQAYLYQTYDLETEEVYKDGAGSEYLGEYYSVHVSEMWEDHSVSWSTFYVSVNFDKVLWKDMVGLADSEFEVYTLEEWRNSSYYPSLDD